MCLCRGLSGEEVLLGVLRGEPLRLEEREVLRTFALGGEALLLLLLTLLGETLLLSLGGVLVLEEKG